LRAGVIGTGWGGAVGLPALQASRHFIIQGVCSARLERARSFADAYGVDVAVDDFEELLGRDDLDVVFVAVPPLAQPAIVRRALESGRHVFSTRPVAPSVEEARALCDLAREAGAVTAVGFDRRYQPSRLYLRNLVRDGYLGELRCVAETLFDGMATDPSTRIHYWNWTGLRDQSGGMLGASIGLSHVDLMRFTFGELERVAGITATAIREKPVPASEVDEWQPLGGDTPTVGMRPVDAEDVYAVQGRLAAGGVFSMVGSWSIHHGSGSRVEAYGSDGTLVLEPSGALRGARAGEGGLQPLPVPPELGGPATSAGSVALFGRLLDELAAVIRGEPCDPSFATFDDAARLQEIVADVRTGP
jgi:predicted dehydrogenase